MAGIAAAISPPQLHYRTSPLGVTFVSLSEDGDPMAAYWRETHCYKIRIDTTDTPVRMEVNSPPAEPSEPGEARVRWTIEAWIGAD